MSSTYSKNNKQLSGVEVVTSDKVWVYNKKTGKKNKLNPNLDIVGKYDINFPSSIIKANSEGHKTEFVDDFSALTKTAKKKIVDMFYNSRGERNTREKVYLVRTDKKSRTLEPLKSELKQGRKRGK